MTEGQTPTRLSLALTPIEPKTFGHDLEVSDRFQKFSEEILRLSLAGVAGIGILLVNCLTSGEAHRLSMPQAVKQNRLILLASLACFGTAALAAVAHRLVSTYSLALHLLILRLDLRGGARDATRAGEKRRSRDKYLRLGWVSLSAGGIFLVLGATTLVWFFYNIILLLDSTPAVGLTPGR